ncbi:endonuclease/exonuclease/phosphatase family protein [Stackebrandtia nassauensis]|uniref:Endonuclease/exonuclease/phosphatase n=1 Tax=Stackebrandtia nassauensis (strain DSM 44728 / CIP 108903 / NRRL B-16338 / NBRC 102104 / LLR-40K-21) TaxID=446470 RepID=D3Q907_STANL|nr:endonuclease/exonuclease/phosphatase family protein [Stackebrandtia nassauensis]ADD40616.1 Endonuclease/exonuclease/phosphatase [Stackebrandtia nassauensis DSM 44728]
MRQRQFAVSRRSLLGGLAIGAIGVTLGAPGTASARRAEARFGCFNIHHGASPDDVMDLERIARRIEALNCDVIGLQEVDRFWKRSGFVDEPAWLAERLGLEVAFGANLDLAPEEPGRPRRQYGTAVLSRWPIAESENTLLPKSGDDEQRGLLRTVLDAPGGAFVFANTHLQHGTDESVRVAQAELIIEILGDAPQRTVLVGDFNAEPGAESIDVIANRLPDAWAAAGDGDGLTYPSDNPHARIDFVFAAPDVKPAAMAVDAEDPSASDHLPLSGTFAF